MTKTYEQMYAFCRGHYYCGEIGSDSENMLWQPFENWGVEQVEEQIETDVEALRLFLMRG